MALIRCPECGREISDKSSTCIGCGAPVTQDSNNKLKPGKIKPKGEESSGGGNVLANIVVVAAAIWAFGTDSGREFVNDILKSFTAETDIAKYDCEKLSAHFTGEKLQNLFGAQFEVISIQGASLIKRDDDKIVCSGSTLISNGETSRMKMTAEKDENGLIFTIEPI